MHLNTITTKANRARGFIRNNLYSCPQDLRDWITLREIQLIIANISNNYNEKRSNIQWLLVWFLKSIENIVSDSDADHGLGTA